MRKNIQKQYSEKIGLAVCDKEPSKAWTLIGHGPLEYSEQQSSEFNIKAILAPLGGKDQIPKSISVPLPIGGIELLQLRRSWYKENLEPHLQRSNGVKVRHLVLNTGKYKVLKLGDVWSNKSSGGELGLLNGCRYLEYESEYGNNPIKLYVPCGEIFRFYYSPSSNFVKAALSSEEAKVCLYNPENREATSKKAIKLGVPCVTLRKAIEDSTAAYVARIAMCDYAEKAFNRIYTDTTKNPENPDKYLISVPPLEQITRWTVDGVEINGAFFVTRIISCYGEFPYKSVLFDRDNNTSGKRTRPPETVIPIKKKKPVFEDTPEGEKKPNTPALGDNPSPSIYTEPLKLEVVDGNPMFQSLDDDAVKKVIKSFLLDESKQTLTIYDGEQTVKRLTSAVASGSINNKNIGQLKIVRVNSQLGDTLSIYEVMPLLHHKLLEMKKGTVELYYFNGEPHPKFPEASIVPYQNYERNTDLCFAETDHEHMYIESCGDKSYLRPMANFEIIYENRSHTFIEFLGSNGFTPDQISSLMFTESQGNASDKLIKNEIKKFDLFGQSWKKKTIGSDPLPCSTHAHRFVHNSKTDIEKKVINIMNFLKAIKE